MKSIFLGERLEVLRVLREYSKVVAVVTSKKSFITKYESKLKLIHYDHLRKEQIFKIIQNNNVNLIVSSGFKWLIPKNYLSKKKIIINSHPGVLPEQKGRNSIKENFIKKKQVYGITIHHIDENMDQGKIINAIRRKFNPNCSLKSIYKRLFKLDEPILLRAVLKQLQIKK